jgi:hypothetical protein
MPMIDNFIAFILTHGRADHVLTYNTLKKHGYTGPIRLIIDNEDKQADEYYKRYPGEVIMFDKAAIAKTFDEGDNFGDRRAIIYARNACFDIAEGLGYTYFIELDDDYKRFRHKQQMNGKGRPHIKNMDYIFSLMVEYYRSIPAKSIAMAQDGDFIGGVDSLSNSINRRRKCMNSFICSTERRFVFCGRINEDVNTYTNYASKGALFLTIPSITLDQIQSQSNKGGMTDLYLDSGTYIKSFYTVMYQPSSVKVKIMNSGNNRLHHSISWVNTVPQIIDESKRKPRAGD